MTLNLIILSVKNFKNILNFFLVTGIVKFLFTSFLLKYLFFYILAYKQHVLLGKLVLNCSEILC